MLYGPKYVNHMRFCISSDVAATRSECASQTSTGTGSTGQTTNLREESPKGSRVVSRKAQSSERPYRVCIYVLGVHVDLDLVTFFCGIDV